MKDIYPISGGEIADLAEVGRKARSLITMAKNGLPVPPGLILFVRFFKLWIDSLQDSFNSLII